MSKDKEIPISSHVSQYPDNVGENVKTEWFKSVGGFCDGMQAIKDKSGIQSLIGGNVVFIFGSITKGTSNTLSDALPVAPQSDGYLLAINNSGILSTIKYQASSKNLDLTTISAGTYSLNGMYLAKVRG